MPEIDLKKIEKLAYRIPTLSIHRWPFTYHHDILRRKIYGVKVSRFEVAKICSKDSDESLYLIALLGAFTIEADLTENEFSSVKYKDFANLYNEEELNDLRLYLSLAYAEIDKKRGKTT